MGEVARHIIILGNNTMAKTTLRVLRACRYSIIEKAIYVPIQGLAVADLGYLIFALQDLMWTHL